ncbi:ferric-chelate reductase [Thozetella sp. PMI_491]|nr:ferric-chelate reductase [Thozetella sp. PMI_491]
MKSLAVVLLGLPLRVSATGPVPVSKSGLAGINGFTFYDPYCGHGCFRSFSPYELGCSATVSPGGHTTASEAAYNLALCRASNFPYLSSIAWCMHLYCAQDVKASTIEAFWETEITGDVSVVPKWSFGEVMANITEPPTMMPDMSGGMDMDMVLNMTMLTTQENFEVTWTTLYYFFRETTLESYYGLAICLTSFGLPIVLTWLRYIPFMGGALERLKPWLYPSIIGVYHDRPLPFLLGNVPTLGQGAYIATVGILNIIFLCINYETLYPDREFNWYTNRYQELMAYWMWRTGVLAFCNMPVLFLFSSRNNILLWLTNWSHSTYMLLHRWIARFFLLHTLLHSIISLVLYQNTGSYATSLTTLWWIWGCVATVAAVIIMLTSVLFIRQRAYELFLITHVVMAVICVVGCWYHVWYGYENTFGYETWLYATIAVWFFDRVARVARILKAGIRRSKVIEISPTIVRVDIPGIRWAAPGRSVYVYFPTLRPLRPWENHPFSMIPTARLTEREYGDRAPPETSDTEKNNMVAVGADAVAAGKSFTNSGLTLFVRKSAGMTGLLEARGGLLTLLEGPYPTNPTREVLQSDRLILIGGGIGITGLVPFLWCHPNAKLFFSAKAADQSLIDSLGTILDELREKEIGVGRRLNIEALLRDEAKLGWFKIAVMVCGPGGMCDDVRAIVARLGKETAGTCSFELEVDAFAW